MVLFFGIGYRFVRLVIMVRFTVGLLLGNSHCFVLDRKIAGLVDVFFFWEDALFHLCRRHRRPMSLLSQWDCSTIQSPGQQHCWVHRWDLASEDAISHQKSLAT